MLQRGGGPDLAFRAYLLTAVRRLHVDKVRASCPAAHHRRPDAVRPRRAVPRHRRRGLRDAAAAARVRLAPRALAAGAVAHRGRGPEAGRGRAAARHERQLGLRARLPRPRGPASGVPHHARRRASRTTPASWARQNLGGYVRGGVSRRDAPRSRPTSTAAGRARRSTSSSPRSTRTSRGLLAPALLGAAAAAYLASARRVHGAGGAVVASWTGRKDVVVAACRRLIGRRSRGDRRDRRRGPGHGDGPDDASSRATRRRAPARRRLVEPATQPVRGRRPRPRPLERRATSRAPGPTLHVADRRSDGRHGAEPDAPGPVRTPITSPGPPPEPDPEPDVGEEPAPETSEYDVAVQTSATPVEQASRGSPVTVTGLTADRTATSPVVVTRGDGPGVDPRCRPTRGPRQQLRLSPARPRPSRSSPTLPGNDARARSGSTSPWTEPTATPSPDNTAPSVRVA